MEGRGTEEAGEGESERGRERERKGEGQREKLWTEECAVST